MAAAGDAGDAVAQETPRSLSASQAAYHGTAVSQQPAKPIEQIIRELGRYPMDAFIFVQECIGAASDKVHGPMSPEQANVAHWMARHDVSPDELRRRCEDGALPPDITRTLKRIGGPDEMNRHVTGQQLCWAIRDVALERWGLMARSVLGRWGITSSEDVGAIIFALVENHWLQKQPTDTIEDFDNVFSFDEALDGSYQIESE